MRFTGLGPEKKGCLFPSALSWVQTILEFLLQAFAPSMRTSRMHWNHKPIIKGQMSGAFFDEYARKPSSIVSNH